MSNGQTTRAKRRANPRVRPRLADNDHRIRFSVEENPHPFLKTFEKCYICMKSPAGLEEHAGMLRHALKKIHGLEPSLPAYEVFEKSVVWTLGSKGLQRDDTS